MEWVVDGQTWYTAQTDHTEKFTCPWQSKFVFSCYYWTSAGVISSVIAMPFAQHVQSYIDLDVFQTFQWECLVSQLAGGSGPSFEVGLSRGVKSGSHPEKLPTH